MANRSVPSIVRIVMQDMGANRLANTRPSRESVVADAKAAAKMGRGAANRSWGPKGRPAKGMADK